MSEVTSISIQTFLQAFKIVVYDFVWLDLMAYQPLEIIQCQILIIYIYILNLYDLVWLCFIAYQPL